MSGSNTISGLQTTLASAVRLSGLGLHTGKPVRMTLRPAAAGTGIVFRRMDVLGLSPNVPALWDHISREPLNSRAVNADGVSVSTVEHLMAACAGTGLHNAVIELDGPEVPALDGSSAGFARAILGAGLVSLPDPVEVIIVERPVSVRRGAAVARLDPAPGLVIDFTIEFSDAAIGWQHKRLDLANGAFLRELCDCRTFCRRSDIDQMRAAGLGLGGSLENAVVVDGDKVLTPGGLRYPDEAVRHKMLDALGDLYTAGGPLFGRYTGLRAGHALTNELLRALFADPANYRRTACSPAQASRLPGADLGPADLVAVA